MSRYLRPRTLDAALDEMYSGAWTPIAGATDIYPAAVGTDLEGSFLDLTSIDGLDGLSQHSSGWTIGGATTWASIADAALPPFLHGLQDAASQIGGVQIQQVATLAGNLCTASPAGDGIPALISLDAEVALASRRGVRSLPIADFVTGYRQTAIDSDELLISVSIPDHGRAHASFQKLGSRSHLVISIAMVSAVVTTTEGMVDEAKLAVGACSPVACRLTDLEARLQGTAPGDIARVVDGYDFTELDPIDDVRATAEYRRRVVPTLVSRAVEVCVSAEVDG